MPTVFLFQLSILFNLSNFLYGFLPPYFLSSFTDLSTPNFSLPYEREMDFWTHMPLVSIMLVKLYLFSILSLTYIGFQIPQGFLGPQALLPWLLWMMSPGFKSFNCLQILLKPMRTAVMAPQETPAKLGNSYLTAKIWNESSNFRHFDFNVSNNHLHLLYPCAVAISYRRDIRWNNFQTVQNHAVGTVPKTYHQRCPKHYCSSPLPYAILWHHKCSECCMLPDACASLGRNARYVVEGSVCSR